MMEFPTLVNLTTEAQRATGLLYRLDGLSGPVDERTAQEIIFLGDDLIVMGARLKELAQRWLGGEMTREMVMVNLPREEG